jgi:asparagine synthase (glutamine-hydrolysing)
MRKHHTKPVITFCLGYEDCFEGKEQDFQAARKMSQHFGTDHHEYLLKASEVEQLLPKVIKAFDSPFAGTVSTYFLSILIHQHVKVALSGDGSDELFGSYLNHRVAFPIERYLEFAAAGKGEWAELSPSEQDRFKPFDSFEGFTFIKGLAAPDITAWRNRLLTFSREDREQLFAPWAWEKMRKLDEGNAYKELAGSISARDMLNASLELDQLNLLPNNCLAFADRLSMAHSIELRVPFLDHRLVELAMRLPGDMKIREGINKYIWKRAAARLIPRELIDRPKEGFVLPVFAWLRTSLKSFAEETLSEGRLSAHGMFNNDYVKRLLFRFFSGKSDDAAKIWSLICFQVWWDLYGHEIRVI